MSKVLDTVTIGGMTWTIALDRERAEEEGNWGTTYHKPMRIVINPSLPLQRQQETLLHELIHAIACTWLTPQDLPCESQVWAISRGLYEVLRHNPKVAEFILGGDIEKNTAKGHTPRGH